MYSSLNVEFLWVNLWVNRLRLEPLSEVGSYLGFKGQKSVLLNHFGHHWYAVEFTNDEELEFVLDNHPWYVRGQMFPSGMWTTHFCDVDLISNLRIWVRIPRLPVQYRGAEILEVITQPICTFVRADQNSLSGLNGLFVRALLEVDLRLPLKRVMVMVIDEEDENPILLSYEKLFEVCFYCGRRRSDGHSCPAIEDRDDCFSCGSFI